MDFCFCLTIFTLSLDARRDSSPRRVHPAEVQGCCGVNVAILNVCNTRESAEQQRSNRAAASLNFFERSTNAVTVGTKRNVQLYRYWWRVLCTMALMILSCTRPGVAAVVAGESSFEVRALRWEWLCLVPRSQSVAKLVHVSLQVRGQRQVIVSVCVQLICSICCRFDQRGTELPSGA